MGGYKAKNYTEQGGDVTRIGGKLVIESRMRRNPALTCSHFSLSIGQVNDMYAESGNDSFHYPQLAGQEDFDRW